MSKLHSRAKLFVMERKCYIFAPHRGRWEGVKVDICLSSLSLVFPLFSSQANRPGWPPRGCWRASLGTCWVCHLTSGGRWLLSSLPRASAEARGRAAVPLSTEPRAGGLSCCIKEAFIFKWKNSHLNLNNGPIQLFDVVLCLGIPTPSQAPLSLEAYESHRHQ